MSCKIIYKKIFICIQFSRYVIRKPVLPNGDGEIRTLDPLLARQVLSQLSYTPTKVGTHLLSHTVASIVPSAAQVLTIVFGMGTGVSPERISTNYIKAFRHVSASLLTSKLQ